MYFYIYIYRYIAFKLAHHLTKKMVGSLGKRVRLETVFHMGWIPGSGPHCDGQFIFSEDLMGTNLGRYPRHSITYVSWPKLGGLVDERKKIDTETGAELQFDYRLKVFLRLAFCLAMAIFFKLFQAVNFVNLPGCSDAVVHSQILVQANVMADAVGALKQFCRDVASGAYPEAGGFVKHVSPFSGFSGMVRAKVH